MKLVAFYILVIFNVVCTFGQSTSGAVNITDSTLFEATSVPDCSSNPTPSTASANIQYGAITLTWDIPATGDPSSSYDLYYGPSVDQLVFLSNYSTNTTGIDLTVNYYNTTIYWKVIPKNIEGEATGCEVWSFTTEPSPGYCLEAVFGQYPVNVFTPPNCDGVTQNLIVEDGYAGEYSLVNVSAGQSYIFSSSVVTDFITISNFDGNSSIIAGITPVAWTADFSGTLRFYTHIDENCNSDSSVRSRLVTCGLTSNDTPDYVGLQSPASATITEGSSVVIYVQVYENGLTNFEPGLSGQAAGIEAWVGINLNDADPSTWNETVWVPAEYNAAAAAGYNDEYFADIGINLNEGTYYYATRFSLNNGPYVYGGTNGTNGNFWDGTTYLNGILTVTPANAPANDACFAAIPLVAGSDFESGTYTTSNFGATATDGLIPSCQGAVGENVWYTVVVPSSGSITLEIGYSPGSQFYDSVMSIYTGNCGSLIEIACSDDGNGLLSIISLTAISPGTLLYVSVWRFTGPMGTSDSGAFQISAYDASLANDTFDSSTFSFYPNPVKNTLNIEFPNEIESLIVYNMQGKLIIAKTINKNEATIDFSSLTSGTYMVEVHCNNQTKILKIIKE